MDTSICMQPDSIKVCIKVCVNSCSDELDLNQNID